MSDPFGDEDGYSGGFGGRKNNDLTSRSGGGARGNARGNAGGAAGYGGSAAGYGGGGAGYSSGGGAGYSSGGAGYGGSAAGYGGGGSSRGAGLGANNGYGEPNDYDTKMMMANKRMEESSAQSLRILNETMRLGIDTTVELERQAESMDITERRLDEMHQDLDQGERNLRKIKSPFGGFKNAFSRKKTLQEVTDPIISKPSNKSKPSGSKSNSGQSKHSGPAASTGNDVVDRNMDEMEKALFQLKGIGELMGDQLDDSAVQISRVEQKLERNDIKVGKLNKSIKRELY